ncbi:hypothetical protein BGZ81_007121 [Podila clonocystis]|nr:hypothetical protein BGZ81_007121 [Podila clonocystis]
MALIATCPKLEVLHVGFLNSTDGENNLLLPAIRSLQHLRELHIENNDRIECNNHRVGLNHGSELPCQRYDDCGDYTFLPLVRLCSNLERIVLPNIYEIYGFSNVARILKATATRLRHLDMGVSQGRASNVVLLIRSITGLETFICPHHLCGPQLVVNVLLEHWRTLRMLDFERTGMGRTTEVMLLSLLKDCLNLESFSAMSALIAGKTENFETLSCEGQTLRHMADYTHRGYMRAARFKLQFNNRVGISQNQLRPDGKVPFF